MRVLRSILPILTTRWLQRLGLVVVVVVAVAPAGVVRAQGGDGGGQTQADRVPAMPAPRIKVGASTLLGVPMLGVERPLQREARTFQWDVLVSPWRSIDGYPFTFAVGTAEWRAYKRPDAMGAYAALHGGIGLFQLQRWDYRGTSVYHEGGNFMLGGSVGRVWTLRGGWLVDAYAGLGTVQSLYKAYDRALGRRVDGAKLWNISGEILPYRTGITIGRFRQGVR